MIEEWQDSDPANGGQGELRRWEDGETRRIVAKPPRGALRRIILSTPPTTPPTAVIRPGNLPKNSRNPKLVSQ